MQRQARILRFWGMVTAFGLSFVPIFAQQPVQTANPILFVTQVPIPDDFLTIGATFGNHLGDINACGRGGDLFIRYPDGELRNLTKEAGFGVIGFQGENSIAVRDPAVHWNGEKALFSMVIGGPLQYQYNDYCWQIYEISGLNKGETAVITKLPNQPENYNNVSPIYGTDDRIIFTSDRPRSGERHLYPQRDEYESAPTTTGLWSLVPATGDLFLLDHSPSGNFTPIIDSFGRVIFTRWDHLQRDQQADADASGGGYDYGTFNYADESVGAERLTSREEIFPEPRKGRDDLLAGTNMQGHRFNHFFPWEINEDGTELETLNHIGRHELHEYFDRALNDDGNLEEFIAETTPRFNKLELFNFFHLKEDPTQPGRFYGTDAPEFFTHSAGQIVTLAGAPTVNPDQALVTYVTHRETADYSNNPSPNHSGLYRNPLPLSDGQVIAVHTPETRMDDNIGTRAQPQSRYDFRLKTLKKSGEYWVADQPLTSGIFKSVTYHDPDVRVNYSGDLWEMSPVEVAARPRPAPRQTELEQPELDVFAEENVSVATLENYLKRNDLALVVSRNVTTRDQADRQQPFNLRVKNTATQTTGAGGKIYDVSYLQFFQGDQIRGYGGVDDPEAGRRILANFLNDENALQANNFPAENPIGSAKIAEDGSMAAFVPARRAMTWQLTDDESKPVVRERYWLTFQPGEIRVCTSCHGLNTTDQSQQTTPQNKPEALRLLLRDFITTAIAPQPETQTPPAEFRLLGNAPNPFSASTQIRFNIGIGAKDGRLVVFDQLGRTVWTRQIVRSNAGGNSIEWRGVDQSGRPVTSGVYFYRLEYSGGVSRVEKLMVLR